MIGCPSSEGLFCLRLTFSASYKNALLLIGFIMAVDISSVWCVDFPSSSGWYSDPGNFEHMYGSAYTCNRGWVVMPSDVWNGAMQSGATLTSTSSSGFYSDSMELFSLFMVAIIAVFALKAVFHRLFFAA